MSVELHGYQFSVYSWIARLALEEKGVRYRWVEINPFAETIPASYLAMQPFQRVPTLVHGDFAVYETGAITRYVDDAFDGPCLQRTRPEERARCNQIISIVDSYAYWPLVRQAFSNAIFRPRMGGTPDAIQLRQGLDAAPKVLSALEQLTVGGENLIGDSLSLADIHLAPMIGYFTVVPEGNVLFSTYPRLFAWWLAVSRRPAFQATIPPFPIKFD